MKIYLEPKQLHLLNAEVCKEVEKELGSLSDAENTKIFAVSRGGFGLGVYLSQLGDIPLGVINIKSYEEMKRGKIEVLTPLPGIQDVKGFDRIIITEDIVDTGSTINYILQHFKDLSLLNNYDLEVYVASLFYNPKSNTHVDFKAKDTEGSWIVFPYEDLKL